MRIAIDATYSVDPHPSGIAVYSRELLKGLADKFPGDCYLECFRLKQWRRRPPLASANNAARILQWPLPLGSPDLFHALNQRVDWRPSKKVVSTFHDLFVMTAEYSSPEFRQRFTAQAKNAAERSDAIIAVSEFTANQVHHLLKVDRSRIRVIPHGVHLPIEAPNHKRENIILSVGALQLRKNTARLVEAFEQLHRTDWKLVLAGSPNGYGAAQIMEKIRSSSAREQIEVAGYVSSEKLEELYASASILAFVSLDEGFGIPILEAMAHGLPVLTSDQTALKEVGGDVALTANPLSTDEISTSLSLLMKDPELRKKLGVQGRKRAAEFSWERTAGETHKLYKQLVGVGKERD